jgi:hypothetical protein
MKNLYLIETSGLQQYYVIADNPTEAQDALIKLFNEQDYGFKSNRRIVNIKWLTIVSTLYGVCRKCAERHGA